MSGYVTLYSTVADIANNTTTTNANVNVNTNATYARSEELEPSLCNSIGSHTSTGRDSILK